MKLHHKIYGDGPVLIILHGLFGFSDNWRTIAKNLENDFRVILVDLRNHGRSPHDEVMNWEVMMEDVHELILDLDFEIVSVLGHSMGGKVAMQLAVTYPEIIDKLIVVDIAPRHYPPHHAAVIEAIQALDPSLISTRSEAEKILRTFLGDDESTIQFLMKNISRLPEGGFEWKANMPVIIQSYENLMEDIRAMHPFLGPVLFIRGASSGYIKTSDEPAIRQYFPEAEIRSIPAAGHWVHADQPEAITDAISGFLSQA